MEEMEGIEDDNHNCRAEAVSVCSPAQVCVEAVSVCSPVDSDSSSDTCESDSSATSALLLNSASKFRKLHQQTSVYQSALATNSCSHKIQGINVCLQNHLWLWTPLPKFITSDFCASRTGVTKFGPGGPVSLQSLAPTLIKHTWSS